MVVFLLETCQAQSAENKERKTFIITGASGELGGAAARLLARDYDLILTGRNLIKLQNLQEELQKGNYGCYNICSLDFVNDSSKKNFEDYLKQSSASLADIVLIPPRPCF